MSDRLTESTVIRVYWPFPERFEKILENKLMRFESSDPVKIEVDCRKMNRITTLHISSLLEAKLCCDERQLSMILVSVNENLQRVIEKLDGRYRLFAISLRLGRDCASEFGNRHRPLRRAAPYR